MKSVIIYSWLSLWSMKNKSGAPSFHKTVELYVKKGWNVYLITSEEKNKGIDLVQQDRIFVTPKNKLDYLFMGTKLEKISIFLRNRSFFKYAKKISDNIIKNNPDDEFISYAYEIYGVKPAKYVSKKYSIPLITRFQGTVLDGVDGNFINKLRYYPHFQALKENADLVIMTNDGTRGYSVLKKIGNKTENIKFWVNGLDLMKNKESYDYSDFRDEIGISGEKRILLTVSRLERWKHVERAIYVLKDVLTVMDNVCLVIVGDGSHRTELEQIVKDECLEQHVFFVGAVPHNQVYRYMANCDVFLSLYDLSNVGNPLLEAQCLGAPVVTLANGDTASFIKNYHNGIILEPNDLKSIPKKVVEILKDDELRLELSRNAVTYAKENLYTWETRMEMEYKEVEALF